MNRFELLKQLFEKWWAEYTKAAVDPYMRGLADAAKPQQWLTFLAGADAQDALEEDWNDPERDVVPDAIVQHTVTFDITPELAELLDKLPDDSDATAAFNVAANAKLGIGIDWDLD